MKKIIFFLIFFYCSLFTADYTFGQSGWIPLNAGTSVLLNKIQFVNSQTGWACGYQSFPTQYTLIKTTNGGLNCISQISNLPFGNRFMSLYFTDANSGFVCGAEGIFRTTNGGNNYFTVANPSPLVYDCFFINANTGWAVGLDTIARIAKTTNGGANWIQQAAGISSSEQIQYVYFANANTGWCTGPNTILKTTNGGTNWIAQPHPTVTLINRIFAISPETAWVTASGTVLTTTNGGANWISKVIGTNYTAISAYFLNANTGYVCTSPRNVFKTTNNGLNWTAQMSDTALALYSIYFTAQDTGYVCGTSGKIYKTVNGGSIGIRKIENEIPEKFALEQNYPNPFNPTTNIKYQITNSKEQITNVSLIVYDILGKEVATLVNVKQSPGTYEVTFDGSAYPSGVYFYQLSIDNVQFSIKKMALIK